MLIRQVASLVGPFYTPVLMGCIMGTAAAVGWVLSTHVVCSISKTVFIQLSPNLVKMFVGIMSHPSKKTIQIALGTFRL